MRTRPPHGPNRWFWSITVLGPARTDQKDGRAPTFDDQGRRLRRVGDVKRRDRLEPINGRPYITGSTHVGRGPISGCGIFRGPGKTARGMNGNSLNFFVLDHAAAPITSAERFSPRSAPKHCGLFLGDSALRRTISAASPQGCMALRGRCPRHRPFTRQALPPRNRDAAYMSCDTQSSGGLGAPR